MASRLSIIVFLLTLAIGHPLDQNTPLLDGDSVSPAPKLSPRTDVSVVDEGVNTSLEKRQIPDPYKCSLADLVFCEAHCDHNVIEWSCIRVLPGRRRGGYESFRKDCDPGFYCIPEFLGRRNDRPVFGCGAKAACVSLLRLVMIAAKSNAITCQGVNADYKGKRPRLISVMFDTFKLKSNIFVPRAPTQITLTDGPNRLVQTVGPADEENGQFISLPFDYIGGVKQCIDLAYWEQDTTVITALVL